MIRKRGSGKGEGLDPEFPLLFQESCIPHFFYHYPESRFSFPQKYIKKSNLYKG